MNRPRQEYRVGIGASSMLTIFVALCVSTLALLALSGARGDAALTARAVGMTGGYYEASDEAQRALAQIDSAVKDAVSNAANQQEFEDRIANLSVEGVSPAYEAGILSFDLDAGGGRKLSVAVRIQKTGQRCRLVRYALTGGELWTGENGSLNLFN
jgi:hypothetical protein